MLRQMLLAAILAGFASGIAVSVVQQWQVIPLILEAEKYETGTSSEAASPAAGPTLAEGHFAEGEEGWAPADGIERALFTLLANVLTGVGFALLLVACYALRGYADWRQGILWGLAAFAAFSLAPSLGLPPEVPGTIAADLLARQVWWLGTAATTALGLALLVFARRWWLRGVALVALVAPHVIGAPHPTSLGGPVPAELAAAFAMASVFSTAVFWIALGGFSGFLYRRFAST